MFAIRPFAILSLVLSFSVHAQDMSKMDPKMQEMMQKVMEAGKPGPSHKLLTDLEGNWTFTMKSWETAKSKPHESKGTAKMTSVLGGRWLQQEVKSDMMGMPYEGMGFIGYDNVLKEYKSIWMDSIGTGVMLGDGQWDAKSKTIKEEGDYSCPITNKEREYRSEWKITDKNNMVYAMYGTPLEGGGKEFKQMEITYKRAK